jgi:hypothetical protein
MTFAWAGCLCPVWLNDDVIRHGCAAGWEITTREMHTVTN